MDVTGTGLDTSGGNLVIVKAHRLCFHCAFMAVLAFENYVYLFLLA